MLRSDGLPRLRPLRFLAWYAYLPPDQFILSFPNVDYILPLCSSSHAQDGVSMCSMVRSSFVFLDFSDYLNTMILIYLLFIYSTPGLLFNFAAPVCIPYLLGVDPNAEVLAKPAHRDHAATFN
jgi:hypothetical protein